MQQLSLINVRTHFTKGGDVYVASCMTCALQLDESPFHGFHLDAKLTRERRSCSLNSEGRLGLPVSGVNGGISGAGQLGVEYAASQAHRDT